MKDMQFITGAVDVQDGPFESSDRLLQDSEIIFERCIGL